MPLFLKKDTVRCFQAACDSLSLAVTGLALPASRSRYGIAVSTAPATGLIGVAAELALSGCLIQANGPRALMRSETQYNSASEILDAFRDTVRSATAKTAFITQGVDDPERHRDEILRATIPFRVLFVERAAGLHAGVGILRDACIFQANAVATFFDLLARSQRIRPYLEDAPRYPDLPPDRTVLLEELVRRLGEAAPAADRAALLRSVYLVLPDIPPEQPEWLAALGRLAVLPTERDLSLLLKVLEKAVPASLQRTTVARAQKVVAVAVKPEDPNALPIAQQYLKTQFTKIPDQWRSDIGNANGRLEHKTLDLPPVASVREVFALGLDKTGILDPQGSFTPHEAWPFVAASLNVQGTIAPYWFVIRKTSDHPQLVALLKKASQLSPKLKRNLDEALHGIQAVSGAGPLAANDKLFGALLASRDAAEKRRVSLGAALERSGEQGRALPTELADQVKLVADSEAELGPVLLKVIEAKNVPQDTGMYWARLLSEAAYEAVDAPALVAVLATRELDGAHTAARKALRLIDFSEYGPPVQATAA